METLESTLDACQVALQGASIPGTHLPGDSAQIIHKTNMNTQGGNQ
jgi:hypothetical protein